MLDGTALLLCKQPRSRGDGDIELLFVGDEINLEAVKSRVFVGTRDGSRLVEMAVPGDLCRLVKIHLGHKKREFLYVNGDLGYRPGVHRATEALVRHRMRTWRRAISFGLHTCWAQEHPRWQVHS